MRLFWMMRDHYSNPQVILIVASSREEAEEMLSNKIAEENGMFRQDDLRELTMDEPKLRILSPPGDRNFR